MLHKPHDRWDIMVGNTRHVLGNRPYDFRINALRAKWAREEELERKQAREKRDAKQIINELNDNAKCMESIKLELTNGKSVNLKLKNNGQNSVDLVITDNNCKCIDGGKLAGITTDGYMITYGRISPTFGLKLDKNNSIDRIPNDTESQYWRKGWEVDDQDIWALKFELHRGALIGLALRCNREDGVDLIIRYSYDKHFDYFDVCRLFGITSTGELIRYKNVPSTTKLDLDWPKRVSVILEKTQGVN